MNSAMRKPMLAVLAAGNGGRCGGLKRLDPMDSHNQHQNKKTVAAAGGRDLWEVAK